jgi:D-alanine-D-alanine ligase
MKIGVLVGGTSNEKEISYKSGKNVLDSLKKLGYECDFLDPSDFNFLEKVKNFDFFMNIIHGYLGEDGRIQSFLEILNKRYSFSSPEACNITFDKHFFKEIFKENFKMPDSILTDKIIEPPFEFPFILKPRRGGSSKGVHIIHTNQEYEIILKKELEEYKEIIIQQYVKGREITISLIEQQGEFIILPLLELIPKKEFYDYEAKYTNGMTIFKIIENPEKWLEEKTKNIANIITSKIKFRDMLRIDAIIKDEEVYVLETNVIPGLTDLSDLPMSAKAAGVSFEELMKIFIKNDEWRNNNGIKGNNDCWNKKRWTNSNCR